MTASLTKPCINRGPESNRVCNYCHGDSHWKDQCPLLKLRTCHLKGFCADKGMENSAATAELAWREQTDIPKCSCHFALLLWGCKTSGAGLSAVPLAQAENAGCVVCHAGSRVYQQKNKGMKKIKIRSNINLQLLFIHLLETIWITIMTGTTSFMCSDFISIVIY